MDGEPEAEFSLGLALSQAGVVSLLALAAGVAVLVLAIRVARRGGPASHALALFAASWLAFLPVVLSSTGSSLPTYVGYTVRWGDPHLQELLPFGTRPDPDRPARDLVCAAGLLLGLAGSVVALARSRPEALARTS